MATRLKKTNSSGCFGIKKRTIILFEVLIALSLTALLLTYLFSFFVECAKLEVKLDSARKAILARSMVQTRIQNILSMIDRGTSEPACLYTKLFEKENQESLVAIFDNGIDPDPAFSGPIMGRLFIDEKGSFTLASWPLSKAKNLPWRTEVLLSQVERFEFEFLSRLSACQQGTKETMKKVNENYAWRSRLPKSQTEFPSIIRLRIFEKNQKQPLQFAFHLLMPQPIPTYQENL